MEMHLAGVSHLYHCTDGTHVAVLADGTACVAAVHYATKSVTRAAEANAAVEFHNLEWPLRAEHDALRTEPNDYQYFDCQKRIVADPNIIRLIHAVLGLLTEIGEMADPLKKHIFYGGPLDIDNMKEELGDASFYLRIGANALYGGGGLASCISENVEKLKKRFPEKFSGVAATARADKAGGEK